MKQTKWLIALCCLVAFCACSTPTTKKTMGARGVFKNFDHAYEISGSDSMVLVTGVFDLKSICLNFTPHTNVTGDCAAYFSEHARGNADSEEVSLKVCGGERNASCIDPLPENGGPEVIVIRDSEGNPIQPWAFVDIKARISKDEKLTGIEVISIDLSPNT